MSVDEASLLIAELEANLFGTAGEEPRFATVAVTAEVFDDAARLVVGHGLRAHGAVQLPPAALSAEDGAAATVDVLAVSLAAGGPGAVLAELAALGPPEQVARVVAELWRADGPHVVPVLAAGEKPVATAARKAAFKARSR